MSENRGLYEKYVVFKVVRLEDGIEVNQVEDKVFVLNPATDPGARFALRAYKVWAVNNGYEKLAQDIQDWLDGYES